MALLIAVMCAMTTQADEFVTLTPDQIEWVEVNDEGLRVAMLAGNPNASAGSFMKHPAGGVHYDGAKDAAVIVEIRGLGPVTTTSVEN